MRSLPEAACVFEQYEAMRREALGADPYDPRGQGLVLFLSRGFPEWLVALSMWESTSVDLPLTGGPVVAPAIRSELTLAWADMVLACSEGSAL